MACPAPKQTAQEGAESAGHKGVAGQHHHADQPELAVLGTGDDPIQQHKQLAQELVRTAIDGVEVINAISVVYRRDRDVGDGDFRW